MTPTNRALSTAALLLAGGQSTRMSADPSTPRKPFLVIEGLTVIEHACQAFHDAPNVQEIVIVGFQDDLARLSSMAASCPSMKKVRSIVAGGELRTDSVRAGVDAVQADLALIAVHDVARPLVQSSLIERAIAVAAKRGAAIVALPITDTVKTSSDGQHTESTLDRSVLWCAQTPQVFQAERFRQLLDRAMNEGFRPTDDAALYERYIGPVPIVEGDPYNLKLTTPADLLLASAILRARSSRGRTRA